MASDFYQNRKQIIGGFMLSVVVIYLIRLVYIQLIDTSYRDQADSNAFFKEISYPPRGVIKDRNGKVIVYNHDAYDIMITMGDAKGLDTLDFCRSLSITRADFDHRCRSIRTMSGYSPYIPQPFMTQLNGQDFAPFQEKLFRLKGISVRKRTLRDYNYACGALVLGNIGEVSREKVEDDPYYSPGDFIGLNGLEKTYEQQLRGFKGVRIWLRDSRGRKQGRYKDGALDQPYRVGKDLTTTLDVDLQAYGEKLMANKVGSVVAIEPATGEILALISAPTFDPSLLVGRKRGREYLNLAHNPYKPLFDRSVMACYPPGSTFKTANGLILQQEQIIEPSTKYVCAHGFHAGRLTVGCHHSGPLDYITAIKLSCNAYFCYGFKDMIDNPRYGSCAQAFEVWKKHVVNMGFGYKLGTDVTNERRGYIPNAGVYDKVYGPNHWRATTIISDAIGQGEILVTPLQLANLAAQIANHGYFYTPHLVKSVQGDTTGVHFHKRHDTGIDSSYYAPVIEGMSQVVSHGTAFLARLDSIEVCGKTGTAENPHGKDHSLFIAFAPRQNPKIAICVVVENAGFGAVWATPIAALMIEKYLNGKIAHKREFWEPWLMNSNLLPIITK